MSETSLPTLSQAILTLEQKINQWYLNNISVEELVNLSNPWKAWEKNWVFSWDENKKLRTNLQKMLSWDKFSEFARQMWRTKITNILIKSLAKNDKKWEIFEKILASQEVPNSSRTAYKALLSAMLIDPDLKQKSIRIDLASKMSSSNLEWWIDFIKSHFQKDIKTIDIKTIKILVWENFVEVPNDMSDKLIFTKIFFNKKTNKLYAIMKNWCKWNLVEINLEEPKPESKPEKPKEKPTIESLIDLLNRNIHPKIQDKAVMSLSFFLRDVEMNKETFTQNIDWNNVTYEKYFLYKDWNNINPEHYIIINKDNPLSIWIWKIDYSNFLVYWSAKDLPVEKTFTLDLNDINIITSYINSL
jgi:hypothetical protein